MIYNVVLASAAQKSESVKHIDISTPFQGFLGDSDAKESSCSTGDPCSIPRSGRSPGEGNGNPLQYSCLRIPWTEEPGGLQSTGSKELGMTEQLKHTHTLLSRFFSQCFLFLGVGDWTMGHTKSWFPDQGLNPCPLKWKCGVSTTGPPGQFRVRSFEGRLHLQCVHLRPQGAGRLLVLQQAGSQV